MKIKGTEVGAQALREAQYLAAWMNSPQMIATSLATGGDGRRLDADETTMLALQLEQMRAKVYEAVYPDLKARNMFPTSSDIDPGADSFAYEESDHVGKFKRLSGVGYAADIPTVSASSTKVRRGLENYGGSYQITLQDFRRAAFSGRPLEVKLAKACRRAWEDKLDEVVAIGDASSGSEIPNGAANRPLGTGAGQTRNTAFTTADWTPATADAQGMLDNLMALVKEFVIDSKETLTPTHLALPLASLMLAQHTYFTDVQGGTVLERFKKDNGFVREVMSWEALKAANHGVGGEATSRGLLWKQDADVCDIVIAQDFTVLPPQVENFVTKVLAHGRTGGFCVYRPLGLRYASALPA